MVTEGVRVRGIAAERRFNYSAVPSGYPLEFTEDWLLFFKQ